LVGRRVDPEGRSVTENVLSEAQEALYVDFLEARVLEFDPDERDVLAHLVALTLVRGDVNSLLVHKGIVEQRLAPLKFREPALETGA
jgi:hypothetical protein